MKVIQVTDLNIEGLKVLRFARFTDDRGYFTEHYRRSDFVAAALGGLANAGFVQCNESYSRATTVRGLHFQWNPHMGKLVRTVQGRLVDLALDIRKGSPTFGKITAYDLPSKPENSEADWIWVPPGFAHGTFFTEDTTIEYFCTGEYSPGNEACISPLAPDIDWSLCPGELRALFDGMRETRLMTDKDRNGMTVTQWAASDASANFVYDELRALDAR